MADVQLENGFLKIANSLFEAIYRHGFTQRELTILLCIVRWTYGFDRKSTEMSLRFIEKDTGIANSHISTVLARLESANVIVISKSHGRNAQQVSLQKDFDKWLTATKSVTVTKRVTVTESVAQSYQKGSTNGYQIGSKDNTSIYIQDLKTNIYTANQDLPDDVMQSSDGDATAWAVAHVPATGWTAAPESVASPTPTAANGDDDAPATTSEPVPSMPKPDYDAEFEEIWKLYPRKKGKKTARDKYVRVRTRKKEPVTFDDVKRGVLAYVKEIKEQGTELCYVKHGSAWMNQECWLDYAKQMTDTNDEESVDDQWE